MLREITKLRIEAAPALEDCEIIAVVTAAIAKGINNISFTKVEVLARPNPITLLQQISGVAKVAITTTGELLLKYAPQLAAIGLQRIDLDVSSNFKLEVIRKYIAAVKNAEISKLKLHYMVRDKFAQSRVAELRKYAEEDELALKIIDLLGEIESHGGCRICNRVRLLGDGTITPCRFSTVGFNIREYGPEQALHLAICNKPQTGGSCLIYERVGG